MNRLSVGGGSQDSFGRAGVSLDDSIDSASSPFGSSGAGSSHTSSPLSLLFLWFLQWLIAVASPASTSLFVCHITEVQTDGLVQDFVLVRVRVLPVPDSMWFYRWIVGGAVDSSTVLVSRQSVSGCKHATDSGFFG